MNDEAMSPLRRRMIEDMTIRKLAAEDRARSMDRRPRQWSRAAAATFRSNKLLEAFMPLRNETAGARERLQLETPISDDVDYCKNKL